MEAAGAVVLFGRKAPHSNVSALEEAPGRAGKVQANLAARKAHGLHGGEPPAKEQPRHEQDSAERIQSEARERVGQLDLRVAEIGRPLDAKIATRRAGRPDGDVRRADA